MSVPMDMLATTFLRVFLRVIYFVSPLFSASCRIIDSCCAFPRLKSVVPLWKYFSSDILSCRSFEVFWTFTEFLEHRSAA